jgi:hypothetical protein
MLLVTRCTCLLIPCNPYHASDLSPSALTQHCCVFVVRVRKLLEKMVMIAPRSELGCTHGTQL